MEIIMLPDKVVGVSEEDVDMKIRFLEDLEEMVRKVLNPQEKKLSKLRGLTSW